MSISTSPVPPSQGEWLTQSTLPQGRVEAVALEESEWIVERYLRWLQDVCRYQPSTVSRRLSVVVGFYRVCVIDQLVPHSPADYVRRTSIVDAGWSPRSPGGRRA